MHCNLVFSVRQNLSVRCYNINRSKIKIRTSEIMVKLFRKYLWNEIEVLSYETQYLQCTKMQGHQKDSFSFH